MQQKDPSLYLQLLQRWMVKLLLYYKTLLGTTPNMINDKNVTNASFIALPPEGRSPSSSIIIISTHTYLFLDKVSVIMMASSCSIPFYLEYIYDFSYFIDFDHF